MHYWWALQSITPGRPGNHAGGPGTLAEQDIWAAHKKALRVKDHVCSAQCGCNGISSEGLDDERERIVCSPPAGGLDCVGTAMLGRNGW